MDRSILFPRARTTIIRRGRNERKKKRRRRKDFGNSLEARSRGLNARRERGSSFRLFKLWIGSVENLIRKVFIEKCNPVSASILPFRVAATRISLAGGKRRKGVEFPSGKQISKTYLPQNRVLIINVRCSSRVWKEEVWGSLYSKRITRFLRVYNLGERSR